jgi:hypothetical protein
MESARATIADITIEVRSNVSGLAAAFAHRYADHPPSTAVHFIYTVLEDTDGYLMWCDHDGAWRWPHGPLSLDAVLFLVDAAAMAALIHYDVRLASMHAAGVERFGVAAAIAADSGGGKTTTAVACARAGMRIYSDERVLVRGTTVFPFLRRCSLRDEYMRPSGSLSWIETFGRQCVASPHALRALFVVNGKGTLSVEEIEPARALAGIARWFDCRARTPERLARAMILARSLRCYSLSLGSPQETAQCVARVLGEIAAA